MEDNSKHIESNELIVQVLSGESNQSDIQKLEEWLLLDSANVNLYNEYKAVWENLGNVKDIANIDLQTEWTRFEKYMGSTGAKTIEMQPRRSIGFYISRIAAVLVIGLFVASATFFTYKFSQTKKLVAENEVQELNLNDGSKVTLNAQSVIKYPKTFKGKKRVIKLEGEAYFEVAHDSTKPFVIEAGNSQVEVLGTSFSVSAYKNSDRVEVVVNTGKVSLSDINNPDKKIILTAGQKGELFKSTGELAETENTDVNFIAWKTKKLIFVDESLERVVALLNKVYRKNIVIQNSSLKSCPITVTFDNQTFDSVLKVISTTIDVNIQEGENEVIISGNGC
jgi:transmembrane sensor